MQDPITMLCAKLLREQCPDKVPHLARLLQNAIRERVERVRDHAIGVVLVDRMMDFDAPNLTQSEENTHESRQAAG